MYLDERSDLAWGLTNNSGMATSIVFPTRIPVIDPPGPTPQAGQGVLSNGDGLISMGNPSGGYSATNLMLKPFGTGAIGSTFAMNVYGWRGTPGVFFAGQSVPNYTLQIPTLMATFSCTLGNNIGVSGTDLGPQYSFAAAIVETYGPTFVNGTAVNGTTEDWFTLSPPTGSGIICIRTLGMRHMECTYQLGTATSANALYCKM